MDPIVSVNIMGGLGNQLFQIAAAYAYSRKEKGRLQIYRKMENGNRPVYWDTLLSRIQSFLTTTPITEPLILWQENVATMYKEIIPLVNPGIYLQGYLQSSKYYYNNQIKDEIKELFRPDESLIKNVKEKHQYLMENRDRVVVIHARRTDYITYREVHGPLDGSYYKQAVDQMLKQISDPIFLLTSDDNQFWDEIKNDLLIMKRYPHVILSDHDEIQTFALLQQFDYFIMSNSTFIWWCVWLSSAPKHVIVPSKWFGPAGPAHYEDIYEPSWERI